MPSLSSGQRPVVKEGAPLAPTRSAREPGFRRFGGRRTTTKGVDIFQLVRSDGPWQIVSIVDDRPNAEHPVPERLRG